MTPKSIRTWADVQRYIAEHDLPYKVLRFNMSLAGVMVDAWNGQDVAANIKQARAWFADLERIDYR